MEIRRELSPSESLLWAGRPRLGIVFRAYDLFLIPFMLLWLAFCVIGLVDVIMQPAGQGDTVLAVVTLTLFILVGIGLGFGRFFIDRWLRARTVYGVSSERILIITQAFRRKVKSLCLDTLTDVTLAESVNGSGIITFGPIPPMYWYTSPGWSNWGWGSVPTLELAEKARQVYETVRDARRAALKRSS